MLGFESALELLTEAVFLRTVPAVAVTVALIFRVAPLSDDKDSGEIGPSEQLTVCPATLQLNGVVVQVSLRFTTEQLTLFPEPLSGVRPAGSVSVTVTPTADAPPRSPTPMA